MKKYVELELELKYETEKAYFVTDGYDEFWLPKSQVDYDGDEFIIPEWLAIKRGLV